MNKHLNVAIVTNVIPQYREDMYRRLIDNYGENLHIYCQKSIPGMNLNLVHNKFNDNITIVNTLSLKKEKLSWQILPIYKLFNEYDVIYFYGNPRVLSNVFWASLFKLLGKNIVIWGQYHTAGANKLMEKFRLTWWKLFDYIFLYTEKEATAYKARFPEVRLVSGMNNGLNLSEIDYAANKYAGSRLDEWKKDNNLIGKTILLSCARLDAKNKFNIFLPVLKKLVKDYPNLIWCVIGNGDEEQSLKNIANELGIDGHITWLGAIYDQEDLAPWFLSSALLLHPGSIGLSLIHAMSYGLPVLTHDNIEMQMPEIAALENNVNGFLFKENNTASMVSKIRNVLDNNVPISEISVSARTTINDKYNTKIMSENFIRLTSSVLERTI